MPSIGACDDTIVVGAVGRLVAEKGYPELFEAMAALDPTRYLLVVAGGEDPDKPDALSPAILDAARERGVVLTGHRDDIETLYAAMDVFVLARTARASPRGDGGGGDGAPGRGHRRPRLPPGRRARTHGLVVPVRDACALAQAISTLGDDPGLRRPHGCRGPGSGRSSSSTSAQSSHGPRHLPGGRHHGKA